MVQSVPDKIRAMVKARVMKRNPIFASQLQRIGAMRILIGALGMYLVAPLFVLLHLICVKLLYNAIVCPLLSVERIDLKRYIIIDRHLIPGLSPSAKFHCVYCGYANGLCVGMAVLLGRIAKIKDAPNHRLALPVYFVAVLLSLLCHLLIIAMYNLVLSPTLGLHRLSMAAAGQKIAAAGFADELTVLGGAGKSLLKTEYRLSLLLANALEQIESQWCPIKHLDIYPDAVFPEHHKNFIDRCELCRLRTVLCTEGSVSPVKPTV